MTAEPCPFCTIADADVAAEVGPCVAIWTNESPSESGAELNVPVRALTARRPRAGA